jgi:phosphohistidine phosphatase
MKKRLYLVRHASAEDLGNSMMLKDFDRELTSFGIIEAARAAQKLVEGGHKADLIISSEANRASETAKIFAEQLKYDTDAIVLEESIYSSGARAYLSLTNGIDESVSSAMIFGHNPDITFFVEYLTRGDVGNAMDNASIAIIDFDNQTWAEISSKTGTLINYITSRNNEQE